MNLQERLNRHLQTIKESNGEISNKEILKLLKNPTSKLKQALKAKNKWGEYLYPLELISNFEEDPNDGFVDSYVDEPDSYMKYCICKASGVESGIDINKAIKDVERNADDSEYIKIINSKNNSPYIKGVSFKAIMDRGDFDPKNPQDYTEKEAVKLMNKGIDLSKIVYTADDDGDELVNPLEFAIDAPDFAKACGAIELANKLNSNAKIKRAKEIRDLIIQA